ncbi:MAG: FHA domain-containing protein [Planctomycetes bacterium]|nr:FHA domain-containing protein [Planctomycetota bacterium]
MNDDTVIRFTPSCPSSEGKALLCVIEGDASGEIVTLGEGALSIGRRPDNDLVLPSPAVSKYHACVRAESDNFSFEDLASTNGSIINQIRLEPHQARRLYHGDVLTLGDHTIMFRYERGGFADKTGMSTISFDMSEVREEAEKLLGDWIKTDT